jgi:hypothetical protein
MEEGILEKSTRGDKGLLFLQLCKFAVLAFYTIQGLPLLTSGSGFISDSSSPFFHFLYYFAPFLFALGMGILLFAFSSRYGAEFGKFRKVAVSIEALGSAILFLTGALIVIQEAGSHGSSETAYLGMIFFGSGIISLIGVAITFIKYDVERIKR